MTVEDEDFILDELIKQEEDKELPHAELQDFEQLSDDFKLERLQNLVKQSQLFSNIISDTLLQSSLAKKRERETQEDVKTIKKARSTRGKRSITSFFKKEEQKESQTTAEPASTIKQPTLLTGATMRDYQLEGTEWLISLYENGLNGILADEMGLGKTIQSIAMLAFLYEQGIKGPFLVTAPLSTVGNWVKEFERFTPTIPVLGYIGLKDDRHDLRKKHFKKGGEGLAIVITSYETVLRDFEYLNDIRWKFLIVDEGHRLKNINCKLIKTLKRLNTSNRLLLTGTPLQNNLNELWSLLNFILPDIFHDLEMFQKWFDFSSLTSLSNKVQDEHTKQLINSQIQESLVTNLHTILKPFLLRRLKKDVMVNLPLKKEFIVYGTLTKTQQELYKNALYKSLKQSVLKFAFLEHLAVNPQLKFKKQLIDQFLNKMLNPEYIEVSSDKEEEPHKNYLRSQSATAAAAATSRATKADEELTQIWEVTNKWVTTKALQNLMMQLRLICDSPYLFYYPWDDNQVIDKARILTASAKMSILDQLLKGLLEKDHKVLIFSQFTKMLDLIQDYLELEGIKHSRFDGSTSQVDREVEINAFNSDPNRKVFLLSTRSGGLGINLTGADSVIIFDSDWNPQVDLQAMDRVHRIGQKKPVGVYRLVLSNTVEEVILAKADSKRKLEKLVIQLGRFQSLHKLMKNETVMGFEKKIEKDNNLAEELRMLLEDDRFRRDQKVDDNMLSGLEMDELLDRSPDAYKRTFIDPQKYPHVQIFETQSAIQ